jgi:hypothetical protein
MGERKIVAVASIFLMLAVAMSYFYVVKGIDTTIMDVRPGYGFHPMDTTFTVDIYCTPAQMVKAYEFKLSYDPEKIQAISVSEGDFFLGYATFFNQGVINNTAGTIINIYGLIIGQGAINTPGVLVTVTFEALSEIGVSDITIYDEGICNDTTYVDDLKSDGSAQIYTGNPPWDIVEDGIVNILDVSGLVAQYGNTCSMGAERWDINIDGKCDVTDISIEVNHYGETY